MRCENCNAEIENEQGMFCPNCGHLPARRDAAKSPGPGEAAPEQAAPEKTPEAPKRRRVRRNPPPRKAAPEATTPAAGAVVTRSVLEELLGPGKAAPKQAAPEKTPEAPKRRRVRRSPPPRKATPEATTPAAGAAMADKEKSTARRRGSPAPRGNASTVPSRPAQIHANALTVLLAAVVMLALITGLSALILPPLP